MKPMKPFHLALLTLGALFLGAIATHLIETRRPDNLAIQFVSKLEPDAHCDTYYQDTGTDHVYSATCRMPDRSEVYCALSTTKGPECKTIVPSRPPQTANGQIVPSASASNGPASPNSGPTSPPPSLATPAGSAGDSSGKTPPSSPSSPRSSSPPPPTPMEKSR